MNCKYCDNPSKNNFCSNECSKKDMDERNEYSIYFYKKNFNYEDEIFEFLYKRKEIIYIRGVGYVRVYDNQDPSVCVECNKKLQERCLSCRKIIWEYHERGIKCTTKCKTCD
jgi:hypothetical protein